MPWEEEGEGAETSGTPPLGRTQELNAQKKKNRRKKRVDYLFSVVQCLIVWRNKYLWNGLVGLWLPLQAPNVYKHFFFFVAIFIQGLVGGEGSRENEKNLLDG